MLSDGHPPGLSLQVRIILGMLSEFPSQSSDIEISSCLLCLYYHYLFLHFFIPLISLFPLLPLFPEHFTTCKRNSFPTLFIFSINYNLDLLSFLSICFENLLLYRVAITDCLQFPKQNRPEAALHAAPPKTLNTLYESLIHSHWAGLSANQNS